MIRLLLLAFFALVLNVSAATYYIDYDSGSDSNNGTATNTAWKVHPYMQGWAGSYSHSAGDRFIFKGGVTWPSSCFRMAIGADGSAGNHDYYGVDRNWYTGTEWARPIFDGAHVPPTGSHLVVISNRQHVTIDAIEIKRHVAMASYYDASIFLYDSANITMTNLWVHDWQLHASVLDDEAHGGIIGLFGSWGMTNVVLTHSTIGNAENSSRNNGLAVRQIGTVKYCTIHDVPSAVLFTGDFHHNVLYNINYGAGAGFASANNYHRNVVYLDSWNGRLAPTTPAYVYNNRIYNWGNGTPPIYPNVNAFDGTTYIFNNVLYGNQAIGLGCVAIDPYGYGATGYRGTHYIFGNTFRVYEDNYPAVRLVARDAENYKIKYVGAWNNHVIGTGSYMLGGAVPQNSANFTNLIQTIAVAAGEGFTVENFYAPAAGASTIDAGSEVWDNVDARSDLDYNDVDRGVSWDIGAYEYADAPPPEPPTPPTLTFPLQVENGLVDSPFATNVAGYVSQAVQTTDPTEGGRVRIVFNIGTNGTYRMFGNVTAETTSSDSVFVDIDAEPTTPTCIWDVQQLTTGFGERYVSWRGNGEYNAPQFGTNTWTLTTGDHTLYLRGREAGMLVDWLTLEYVPPDVPAVGRGVRLGSGSIGKLTTN